jgi:hypothetical protein
MERPAPCRICNKASHDAWHCPELYDPLTTADQFFRPTGGRPAQGDDDEKASVSQKLNTLLLPPTPAIRDQQEHDDSHIDYVTRRYHYDRSYQRMLHLL